MSRMSLDTEAPNFTLKDFTGKPIELASYKERKHVLLVFNRGFV